MSNISLREELEKTKEDFKQENMIEQNSNPTLLLAETNEVRETEAFRALGLVPEIEETLEVKGEQLARKNLEDKYGTIYSATEIKALCMKYGLRILKTKNFTGPLKGDMAAKILDFNEIHGVTSTITSYEAEKYYILAPAEAFGRSSRKSKLKTDPILLYKVDSSKDVSSRDNYLKEAYYTVVYEWGSSFNIWRMITSYRKRNVATNIVHTFFTTFALTMIASGFMGLTSLYGTVGIATGIGVLISIIKMAVLTGDSSRFAYKLIYRSWNKENH